MDFFLNDDQKAIREGIREFADKEVAPKAAYYDKTHEFPMETFKKLGEQGWLCMNIPEKYGGAGADYLSYAIALEELSRADATVGVVFEVHCTLNAEVLLHFASEEQKMKYLPRMARGEIMGAYCLTEPTAGSNPAQMKTRAVKDGDHYILNGQKTFISNGGVADLYIVMAVTDPSKGGKGGISAFVVEKGTEGLSFGKPEEKLGIRASSTCDVFFNDCRIPKENLIDAEGQGLKVALATLDSGRIGIASQAVGITQRALDLSVPYAKEREQFGKAIAEFQAIQWKLANMATELDAARLMVYRAAFLRDKGNKASKECSMAKLFASEVAMRHTVEAVQIFGGYGYIVDYQVERLMRDAKIT